MAISSSWSHGFLNRYEDEHHSSVINTRQYRGPEVGCLAGLCPETKLHCRSVGLLVVFWIFGLVVGWIFGDILWNVFFGKGICGNCQHTCWMQKCVLTLVLTATGKRSCLLLRPLMAVAIGCRRVILGYSHAFEWRAIRKRASTSRYNCDSLFMFILCSCFFFCVVVAAALAAGGTWVVAGVAE